jgi:hypothetical protein
MMELSVRLKHRLLKNEFEVKGVGTQGQALPRIFHERLWPNWTDDDGYAALVQQMTSDGWSYREVDGEGWRVFER